MKMFEKIKLQFAAILFVITASVFASGQQAAKSNQQSAAQTDRASANALVEGGSYTNRYGAEVHRPAHTASGQAPAGASAQCRDGSYSFSQSRRGTCSHHGGVGRWL